MSVAMMAPNSTGERPAAGQAALMRLRDIRMTFGQPPHTVDVLHGIDLDLRAGEICLLTGPSGSGKTTLLTIMGLLQRPSRGAMILLGRDVSRCSEFELCVIRRESVCFIFQSFNLLSALTAAENVQVGLEIHGTRGRQAVQRSRELLERVGLGHRSDHRPAELSGGEKQRVGIARALASPAPIVLADEPTGNLDGATSRPIVELLRSLAEEQRRAVVVVTHDPRLEPLADRIIRIEDGRITSDAGREVR
jgi:putative ABC transport system ATP-binding protein